MSKPLTVEQFQMALPEKVKKTVSQKLVDQINGVMISPETMEIFKDNLLSYADVLQKGRFKMSSYISAVLYVSFKLHGSTNKDAYIKTFPGKYKRFLAQNVSDKDISSYVHAYNDSKLVTMIYGQTLTPFYIVNAPARQKALNVQISLMTDKDVSSKVRCEAANSVLTHLKPPEEVKLELDVGVNHTDVIDDYEKAMSRMVDQQKKLIEDGGDLLQITNASIKATTKEADAKDVTPAKEVEVKLF